MSETRQPLSARLGRRSRAARGAGGIPVEELLAYIDAGPAVSYVLEVDAHGMRTRWVSASIEVLLGYTVDEALAPGWWFRNLHPEDRDAALARAPSPATTGETRQEFRFTAKDGSVRWVLDAFRRAPGDGKAVFVGSWSDITERKRVELALRESEDRLRQAERIGSFASWEIDLGGLEGARPGGAADGPAIAGQLFRVFGHASLATSAVERGLRRLHGDDRAPAERWLAELAAGAAVDPIELRVLRADGSTAYMQVRGERVRADGGRPARLLGTAQDVTAAREHVARQALHARLADTLLDLPDVAERVDERDFLRHGLEAMETLTESRIAFLHFVDDDCETIELVTWSSRTLAEYCRAAFDAHYPVSKAGIWAEAFRRREAVVFNDYATAPNKRGLPPGHAALERLVSVPVIEGGRVRMLVGVGNRSTPYTDEDVRIVRLVSGQLWRIVQRRRTELALRRSASFNRLLLDQLAEGVIAADAEGHLTLFNQTARGWVGVDPDPNLTPSDWAAHYGLYQDDGKTPFAPGASPLARAVRGEFVRDARMVIQVPGRAPRWVIAAGGPVRDDDGHQVGALVAMRDVSHKRAYEQQLAQLSTALEAAANAVLITDRSGRVEWANAAFTRLCGYARSEVIGRNPRTFLRSGVHDRAFYADLWSTILAGRVWEGEITNRRKDGTLYPEALTITPVRGADQHITHFICIKRDLTDERALQARSLQSQKMESIGRLAGGVAHDFNNLLTIMNGLLDLSIPGLRTDDPLRHDLEEVRAASRRATTLVRQLLTFSRQQPMRREKVDLNRVVSDLTKMLSRLIGEDVVLATELGEVGTVIADGGHVEQVIVNLAVNARDAMPRGGTLTVATRSEEVAAEHPAWHPSLKAGRFAVLSVRDTGKGMDGETKARLFEPFFTTKEVGRGTGLGLATVYGVVRQAGGNVVVTSELGHGTTFDIYLPIADALADLPPREVATSLVPAGARKTIVVVDDEAGLRRVAVRMLSKAGYQVLAAPNGPAALALLERHPGGVDLLVTDVVMPEMSGPELVASVAARDPGLRIIFSSGYGDEALARLGVRTDNGLFLPKPYTVEQLSEKVAEVLSGMPVPPPTTKPSARAEPSA